jgi:hypothetical protein
MALLLSGHLAPATSSRDADDMEEEMGIYREEVTLIMEVLADIRHDMGRIRRLLEDDDEPEEEENS